MIPKLFVHRNLETLKQEVDKTLAEYKLSLNHPNVFFLDETQKLGVEQAKKIREHLSTKPYSGTHQAVVVLGINEMSIEAQNSLLKTLEEPPGESLIIMAGSSSDNLLPTILSRCQVIKLEDLNIEREDNTLKDKVKLLEAQTLEQRFSLLEKLEEREEFLVELVHFYREKLLKNPGDKNLVDFMKELLKAQKLADQNVTIRAILEYLMLKLPTLND